MSEENKLPPGAELSIQGEVDFQTINDRYINLWTSFAKRGQLETTRYPMQYPSKMSRGSLLFVGCNPSFRAPENIKPKTLTGLPTDMREEDYSRWEGELNPAQYMAAERQYQNSITKTHVLRDQYYRILDKVCTGSGMPCWEHIDLFGIRETNQNLVLKMLGIQSIGKDEEEIEVFEISEFAATQIQIALEAISLLAPLAIVVISAISSKVLKSYSKQMKMKLTFREDIGTYVINVGEKPVPVFLAGMLARQRALDVFSRERLIWHIRHAYTLLKKET